MNEEIDWSALDEDEKVQSPPPRYRGWAFRFFLYSLITHLATYVFIAARPPGLYDPWAYQRRLAILGLIAMITLVAALFMLILSHTRNEAPSLKRKITLAGIIVLGIFQIVTKVMAAQFFFSQDY